MHGQYRHRQKTVVRISALNNTQENVKRIDRSSNIKVLNKSANALNSHYGNVQLADVVQIRLNRLH